jgi:hypothetical protein
VAGGERHEESGEGKDRGCLETFLRRGPGHRFEMLPIPQVRNAPGAPVGGALLPSLINSVGPELAIRFLTGEPRQDADHDRVGHGHDGPLLPTACRETLRQRGEVGVGAREHQASYLRTVQIAAHASCE